jgi:hypothetical protein
MSKEMVAGWSCPDMASKFWLCIGNVERWDESPAFTFRGWEGYHGWEGYRGWEEISLAEKPRGKRLIAPVIPFAGKIDVFFA